MYFATQVLPYWAGAAVALALMSTSEDRRADRARKERIHGLIEAVRRDRLS